MNNWIYILLIAAVPSIIAQQPIKTTVDRDQILMGQEVKLGITIDALGSDLIIFPEQAKMGALEVIESYPIDTIIKNDRLQLYKQYGITQWDSGDYHVPQLKIIKNEQQLLSDSILIKVREVQVDTTKQKMYDIKPVINIPDNRPMDWSWLWWLLLLVPLGLVVYTLSRKRVKQPYEQTLQPYEWTKYRLQQLDQQNLVELKQLKEYYTDLTYIIKKYIDSKVYGLALESTTPQLLTELKNVMQERGMHITTTTENRLQEILERADLAKFAGIAPDAITAKQDRLHTNDIIYNIHQVLPPPTEQELMHDAKYQQQQRVKALTRKVIWTTAITLLAIITSISAWIYIDGIDNVQDRILGNQLRDYYEQDWLTSAYGVPDITITTPDVLVRSNKKQLLDELDNYIADFDHFTFGDFGQDLTIDAATYQFNTQAPLDQLTAAIITTPVTQELEQQGATNIVMLDKELDHNGLSGFEITGSYQYNGNQYKYDYWIFNKDGGMQQIVVTYRHYDQQDPNRAYGRLINDRILSSIKIASLQTPNKQSGK